MIEEKELRKQIAEEVSKYYKKFIRPRKQKTIHVSGKVFDEEELINAVEAVLDAWWTEGRWSIKLSNMIKEFLGSGRVLLTNSGSSANLVAISSLFSHDLENHLRPGDEIITAAAGFPTTVNPIIQNSATPVFVDSRIDTYNIDESKIEDAITDKTKAIIVAHTLGNPVDIAKIKKITREYDLFYIEDNCDAFSSEYNGKKTGTFGDMATLSFYPAHHITTGEGGALIVNNSSLEQIARSIRDWGRDCWCPPGVNNSCGMRFKWKVDGIQYDHKYVYSRLGYNLKITDLQSSIGVAQMKKIEKFRKIRQSNFDRLRKLLDEFSDRFMFMEKTKNSDPSWFGFTITLRENSKIKRQELISFLQKNGIDTRYLFAGNLTRQPYMKHYKHRISGRLDNADFIMKNSFWVGIYPALGESEIEKIYETIKRFFITKGYE